MDARKHFSISSFPNFIKHIDYIRRVNSLWPDSRYEYYDTALIAEGFKSAQYHEDPAESVVHVSWSMSEEEYTLFVLRWS